MIDPDEGHMATGRLHPIQARTTKLIAGVLALLVVSTAAQAASVDGTALDRMITTGMDDWGIPGMAVAVLDAGKVVHAKGYGTTAVEDGVPVDAHTPFANASTTKAMVAAGVLMLVDEGRLDLDAPLIDVLPELHFGDPALTPQLTLRDLLTHRTGLPSTDFWTFNQGMALADQVPRLRAVSPAAAVRSRKIYQNTMYELAGLAIERVTGQRWDVFLTERLWGPIGMQETWGHRGRIPSRRAHAEPHDEVAGELRAIAYSLRPQIADAAGSVWSTVSDMMRWARFLLAGGVTDTGERLLSEQAVEEMFSPQFLVSPDDYYPTHRLTDPNWISYGLGWYQQDFQGRKIDYHTGSLNGFVTIFGLDRARGRAMIAMANREGAELRHALLFSIMDAAGIGARDWHGEVFDLYAERERERDARWQEIVSGRLQTVKPSLPPRGYAGHYDSARSGPIEVRVDGRDLTLHTLIRDYTLEAWHADTFLLMHRDWNRGTFARFALAPDGTVEALEVFGDAFARTEP